MGLKDTNQEGRAQPLLVGRGKALLVHEDPGGLHHYCSILEGWGYQVRACHSYEEGVCCLGSEVFDFVMVSQGSRNFEERGGAGDRDRPPLARHRRAALP